MSTIAADVFDPATTTLDLKSTDRWEAIDELVGLLADAGRVSDPEQVAAAVRAREDETGGTGMESGVAIPHTKSAAVTAASVGFARSAAGVDFGAEDGTPADLIFLVAVPEGADELHVRVLSRLARRLIHEEFRNSLRRAATVDDVVSVMREEVQL